MPIADDIGRWGNSNSSQEALQAAIPLMDKRTTTLAIMLLVLSGFASACSPCTPPTSVPAVLPTPYSGWTTYNADDGLGGDQVAAVVVSPDRAVWVGLRDEDEETGVLRFDPLTGPGCGKENLTRYTIGDGLPNRMVLSIAAEPDGVMWFGTEDGVWRFDPSTLGGTLASGQGGENWTTYKKEHGLPHNEIRSIAVGSDGAVWFATGRGVARFDPSTLGGTPASGQGKENWTTYTKADGLVNDDVYAVVEAPDGAVWFGTEGGVSRFDPAASGGTPASGQGKENWTTYTTANGLASDNVRSAAVGLDGALWFGTEGGGVSRFDPVTSPGRGGESWTTYTSADGLAPNIVYAIATGPGGVMWFGTYGGGVSRFDPATLGGTPASGRGGENWTTFTEKDGLADNNVRAVAVSPSGAVWIGTDDGLSRYVPVDSPPVECCGSLGK